VPGRIEESVVAAGRADLLGDVLARRIAASQEWRNVNYGQGLFHRPSVPQIAFTVLAFNSRGAA
jgi:hypothetical protein